MDFEKYEKGRKLLEGVEEIEHMERLIYRMLRDFQGEDMKVEITARSSGNAAGVTLSGMERSKLPAKAITMFLRRYQRHLEKVKNRSLSKFHKL